MEKFVILYDDDCGFCRWSLDKILSWDRDGRLRPVALQSGEADILLRGMDEKRKMASWHLVRDDGRIYSAGAAAAPLFRNLPFGTPLGIFAEIFPGLTEFIYRMVSTNRDWFGNILGEQACSVTPGDGRPGR